MSERWSVRGLFAYAITIFQPFGFLRSEIDDDQRGAYSKRRKKKKKKKLINKIADFFFFFFFYFQKGRKFLYRNVECRGRNLFALFRNSDFKSLDF